MNAARAHLLLGDGAGRRGARRSGRRSCRTAAQAAEELLDLHGARAPRRARAGRGGGDAAQGGAQRAARRDAGAAHGRVSRPRAARSRAPRSCAWRRRARASASSCWWRGRGWPSSAGATRWPRASPPRRSRACAGRARRARSRPRPTPSSAARSTSRARSSLALRALKTATELDSRMARAWYTLGLVDFDLQRMADARTAMESAVKADPLYADAWYYLGRTRAALGRSDGEGGVREVPRGGAEGALRRRGARRAARRGRSAAADEDGYADQFSASNPSPGTVSASAPSAG